MGVLTLLKHLAPCLEDSHVERYRGKTVAIDGNTFIFRGCYGCSEQVSTGQACAGPVEYLLKRVRMLRHYGVKPWVVLDGRRTPMKDDTNNQRREERNKNLSIAKDFRRQADEASGAERDALRQKAQAFFQKSIHVTRQMVTNAMAAMKKEGVECMVAPYEADAQVAFLVKCGLASAVITEDSDILVYMAAVKSTASVLYKMDEFGKCKELGFDPEKLSSLPGEIGKFGRGLAAFAGDGGGRMFVQLAALAGCDYVDNVRGLGLLSALPIIRKFKTVPPDRRVSRVLMHLQKMGKTVPEGHRERMLLAEMSFFWHRVYDPRSRTCVHFCSASPELAGTAEIPALPSAAGGTDFLGEHIGDDFMVSISRGRVDPATGEPVTAEIFPIRVPGSARRSMTQPSPSVSRGRSTSAKSATMPMTTPRGTWNQQQREREGRSTGEARSIPQHARKQSQGPGGRVSETLKKNSGGGGSLKDMFERASSKAGEKENMPASRDAAFLGVSEIVLACGPQRTPSHGRASNHQLSAAAAAATPNPFAKAPRPTTTATASPSNFLTPSVATAGAQLRSDAAHSSVSDCTGGGADAWSRLSRGCLAGAETTASHARDVALEEGRGNHAGVEAQGAGTLEGGGRAEPATKPVGKRPLPSSSRGGKGGDRGKKAKARVSAPTGKGLTMTSFFGRKAALKP